MSNQTEWKKKASKEAAKLVTDDMTVGLGSGTTVGKVVEELGKRNVEAQFVAASTSTQRRVERLDLKLTSLEKGMKLDLTIDGADEIDPNFDMIKGGGGAHTREKIVANATDNVAIVVDKTKIVKQLGEKTPIPTEIIPFAKNYTSGLLEKYGEKTQLRKSSTGEPFITDNGNFILDLEISEISKPAKLETKLNQIPGIIENGIFSNIADEVYVGFDDGCEILTTKEDFRKIVEKFSL